MRGTDYQASHDEDQGINSSGQVVSTPQHRHRVSLDFVRIELGMQYTFENDWDLWTRLPYDIKKRSAEVELVDAALTSEQADMQRNLDLHHRDETLEGLSDMHVLLAHSESDLIAKGDITIFAFGTSLPTGRTQEDPFVAGASGLPHEHMQFGTGTFDPLLELYYGCPISTEFRGSAFGMGRFPFYENDKGYQGSTEVTLGLALSHATTDWLTLHASLSGFYQDHAHWNGTRDINSGIISTNWMIGAEFHTAQGMHTNLNVRFPISQRTLSNSGDSFEQGPVLLFTTSYSF